MALYLNGNKIVNGFVIDGGGGGSTIIPTFSETQLVDNSSLNSSFTLSESYNNYQFVRVKLYNSSSGIYTNITTTPEALNAILDIVSYVNFNELNNNQYCCYLVSSDKLTWTRNWQRSCDIYEIAGLTCTNATVTKTQIYKAPALSGSAVQITTLYDLFDFDWIMFASNDNRDDEVQPCNYVFVVPPYTYSDQPASYTFNEYSASHTVFIYNNSMSAYAYTHILGINFT